MYLLDDFSFILPINMINYSFIVFADENRIQ